MIITYMWNLKKEEKVQVNLFTELKETHRCRKEMYG